MRSGDPTSRKNLLPGGKHCVYLVVSSFQLHQTQRSFRVKVLHSGGIPCPMREQNSGKMVQPFLISAQDLSLCNFPKHVLSRFPENATCKYYTNTHVHACTHHTHTHQQKTMSRQKSRFSQNNCCKELRNILRASLFVKTLPHSRLQKIMEIYSSFFALLPST